ncbi:hypothetical protein GETHLI_23910 [Geothrix limicola]|uniref:DUF885 domain-containing protein n=1 Tax=Geothrix limicola TaxID=2927978 RepID=A0ABQ5QIM6_9BACT|nr:DUF885 domain-containing protein [Geothrix limicola]GLH73889.1 hypothetical protein GETHLI_23910 [Geothrix limicola]
MTRQFLLVPALLVVASTAPAGTPAMAPAKAAFARFKSEFIEAYWKQNPESAVAVGYYKYADRLPVPDAAERRRSLGFGDLWLRKAKAFDEASLDVQDRVDLRLIRNELESERWAATVFRGHQWDPSSYNVAGTFGLLLGTEYAPLDARLRVVGKRLPRVPAYYAAAKAALKDPTLEHTQLAILQNKGALGVFGADFLKQVEGSTLTSAEKARLKADAARAQAAIQDYITHLEGLEMRLRASGWRSFRIGKKLFETSFEYSIQAGCTAEELHRRALAEKEKLHGRMAELALQLWPKYFGTEPAPADRLDLIGRMVERLSQTHVSAEGFVAEVKRQIPLLESWVREHDLVNQDPTRPLVVRETPEYMRGVAGASVSAPGPYDPKANTYYNVTPLEGTAAQKESYLREYNEYILQVLNIHEAIPGHYVQLLHANQSPSLVKAVFGNGAMVEGWAVYAERMMLESGYGGNTPEMWLMYSKWNLRVVCNAILDYGVHVEGMGEAQAMRLLTREAFQQDSEAREKWHRAQVTSVQLSSYFAGYSAIYDLRERLKAQQGRDFDLKRFHEQFLSYGSAPVKVIRELMLPKVN